MNAISQTTFPNAFIFFNKNVCISINISLKSVSKCQTKNIPTFSSDNGVAPTRRRAIIWTNDG